MLYPLSYRSEINEATPRRASRHVRTRHPLQPGEAIALNADGGKPMFAGPVAVMAPKDAKLFLAAAVRSSSWPN